jgi:ATP-dependent Lhr-like helicase
LVIHAPFGGRINRAWGLALRKRFCVTFDFELQAAATDNGIVISLGERHSFPLDSVFGYVRSQSVREVLMPAVLQAPMFMTRWRWNVSRALVLLRFVNGKKIPPQIQRMKAEDLLAAVFPDALACQDNMVGDRTRQIPDHPLVNETVRDCLTDAMDLEGLTHILARIEQGAIRCVAVDTPIPSPFSHEILNANPYAFLDDAPLEERRARAVEMRRTLPPDMAGRVGALDPSAIEEVMRESWPVVRDPDELHDALLTLLWLPESSAEPWSAHFPALVESGQARALTVNSRGVSVSGWVATENRESVERVFASGDDPLLDVMVLGWMESIGPTTTGELADRLYLAPEQVAHAMLRLESSGQVLRGQFRSHSALGPQDSGLMPTSEWCHRRLLARIHRLTIGTLRKEVEPVTAAEFMKFLLHWQHAAPGSRLHGEAGLLEVVRQLAGFETAASAWEPQLLRLRLAKYGPDLLDHLCLSGAVSWGRLSPHPCLAETADDMRTRRILPTSAAPISLFPREDGEWLLAAFRYTTERTPVGSSCSLGVVAQKLRRTLAERGACFFADLVRATGSLATEVEEGLWELIAAGIVTADGFDNLRALIDPHRRRAEGRERSRRPRHAAGRWSLLRPAVSFQPSDVSVGERVARMLLRRYGVVFRDLLARESLVQSWRDLLVQYRRMEMTGEVRGGRFVSGLVGEQFALPEAVESLRAIRRGGGGAAQEVKVSACDPLNLAGIILPSPRVPALRTNFLVLKDGVVVRIITGRGGEAGTVELTAAIG